eukprot:GGOE01044187.1.p1 GENE.GGOE01044187.1~~GGOE01044187.1.p1  ORF type:complete len:437 (+),score=82.06 GGOE01044187.1:196-1311(+)
MENTVYDSNKNVLWAPDKLMATALDGQDGQYDGKYYGAKIKVMKQKNGALVFPGNPAEYGYPERVDPKDPYVQAGVAPGGTAYDSVSDTILAPDELTATQLDAADGVMDGRYFGTKIKVKKSKMPAYNPELAMKNAAKAAGKAPMYATYARPPASAFSPGSASLFHDPRFPSFPHSGFAPPPAPHFPTAYAAPFLGSNSSMAQTYLHPAPYGGLSGMNFQPGVPPYPSDFVYYPSATAAPTYYNGCNSLFGPTVPLHPTFSMAPTYRPVGLGFGAYDVPAMPAPLLPTTTVGLYGLPTVTSVGPAVLSSPFTVPAAAYLVSLPVPDTAVAYQAGSLSPVAVWGPNSNAPNPPTAQQPSVQQRSAGAARTHA